MNVTNSVLYIEFLENELRNNHLISTEIISKKYQESLIHILKDKKEYINFFYISLKLIKSKTIKLLITRLKYLLGKDKIVIKRKDFKTNIEYLEKLSQLFLISKNIDKDFIYLISEYKAEDKSLNNLIEMFKYTNLNPQDIIEKLGNIKQYITSKNIEECLENTKINPDDDENFNFIKKTIIILDESSILPSKKYISYLEKLFIVNNLEDKLEDIQEGMNQVFLNINIVKNMIEKFSKNKTNIDLNEMKLEIESEFILGNIDINEKEFLSNFLNFLNEIQNISDKKTRSKILYNYTYDYVSEDINEIINYDNIVNIDGISSLSKLQRSGYNDEYIELQKDVIKNIQIMRGDNVRTKSDFLFIKTKDLVINDDIWISLFEKINMFKVVSDSNNIDFRIIFNKVFYNVIRDFILSLKYFKENNVNDYYKDSFYYIKDGNIKIHTYNYITDILTRINTLVSSEINRYQIDIKRINFLLQSTELLFDFLYNFKFSYEEDIDINMIEFILDEKLDIFWEEETKNSIITKSRDISSALIEQILTVGNDIYNNFITIKNKKDIGFYNILHKILNKLNKYKIDFDKNNILQVEISGPFKGLLDRVSEEDQNFVLKNMDLFKGIIPDFNASERRNKSEDRDLELFDTFKYFIKLYKKRDEKIKSKILIEKHNKIMNKKELKEIKEKEIIKSKKNIIKLMKDAINGQINFEEIYKTINKNNNVIKRIQEIDNIQIDYDISSNSSYLNEINKLESILEQNINLDSMINFNLRVIKQIFKVDINFKKFKTFIDSNKRLIIKNSKKSLSSINIKSSIDLNIKVMLDNHIKYLSILYLLYFHNKKINFNEIKQLDFKRYNKVLIKPDLIYHDLSDNEKIIGKTIGSIDKEGFIKFLPEDNNFYKSFYNENKIKKNEIKELYKYMNVIITKGNYKGYIAEYRGRKLFNKDNDDLIEHHSIRLEIFKNNLERYSFANKDYNSIEILEAEKKLLKSYRNYRNLDTNYNYLYSVEEYNKIIKNRLVYLNDLQINIDVEKKIINKLRNVQRINQIIVNIRTGTKQAKNITISLNDIIIKKDKTYRDILSNKRKSIKKIDIEIDSFFKLFKYISYNIFFDDLKENIEFIKLFQNQYKFCIKLLNNEKDKIINMNLLFLKLKEKMINLKQNMENEEDKEKINEYKKSISLINKRLINSFKGFSKLEKEDNLTKLFKKDLKIVNNSYIIKINNNEMKKDIEEYNKIIIKMKKEKELNNKNVLNKILFKSIMNFKRVKINKNTIHQKTIKKVNILIPLLKSRNIIFDNGDLFVDPDSHIKDVDNKEDIEEVLMFQEGSDYINNKTSIVALEEEGPVDINQLQDEDDIYKFQYEDELREEIGKIIDVGIKEKKEEEEKGLFESDRLEVDDIRVLSEQEEKDLEEYEKRKNIKEYLKNTKEKEIEIIKKEKDFELTQEEFEEDEELMERFAEFN